MFIAVVTKICHFAIWVSRLALDSPKGLSRNKKRKPHIRPFLGWQVTISQSKLRCSRVDLLSKHGKTWVRWYPLSQVSKHRGELVIPLRVRLLRGCQGNVPNHWRTCSCVMKYVSYHPCRSNSGLLSSVKAKPFSVLTCHDVPTWCRVRPIMDSMNSGLATSINGPQICSA